MKNKPIFDYIKRSDGTSEFEDFLDQLPEKDAAKLLATIEKTEKYGIAVAARNKWVKKLETNLYEVRSKVSSNIQRVFYFHVIENRYVITHGFTKKTDKTPESEKKRAREIRNLFMEGEKNGNN